MTHTTRNSILLFFGLVGLVIVFLYIGTSQRQKDNTLTDTSVSGTDTTVPSTVDFSMYEQSVKNALITVPDTNIKISLVDGRASYGTTQDGGDVTLIKLLGGERLSGNMVHMYADIAVQSGGTGVFHYIVLFDVSSGKPVHLSSYFIGDRIDMTSASLDSRDARSYMLKVQYLDRGEGEALSEDPTVHKEVSVEVRNNLFVEKSL